MKFGDLEFVGHGGGYPGFITRSSLNQEHKIIIVALTNAVDGPALTIAMDVGKLIDFVLKNAKKLQTDENEIIDFKEIIGFYATDRGTELYSRISNKLLSITPDLDIPVEGIQIYEHKDEYRFKNPSQPMYGAPGQLFRFVDGPDGHKIIKVTGGEIKRFYYSY